jgi:hypothetical protein
LYGPERSDVAAAPARISLVIETKLIIAKIENQFESACREYPLAHMETRVAVDQPEVLDEV